MNPHVMILIISFLYIVVFGGIALLRREGLSTQFAFEVLGITALVEIAALALNFIVHPIIFLVLIYFASMRVRIIVDLATVLSNRGRQRQAMDLLQFSLKLFPDRATRLVVLVNMGIVQIRRQNPQSAKELLEMVLQEGEQGGLGVKYESACRYNLGVAYQKLGNEAEAARQFNEAILALPSSIFSRAAQIALDKRKHPRKQEADPPKDEQDSDILY